MELRDLQPFVVMLVLIGMLLGIGIVVLDSMASSSYDTMTETNRDFTEPTLNNTNITLLGPLLSDVVLKNGSGALSSTNRIKVYTAAGVVTWYNNTAAVDGCTVGGTACSFSYTWKQTASETYTALSSVVSDAVAPIASSWIGLIVTVVILSLILGIVITSFRGRR